MKEFVIAAVLAAALGLSVPGTAEAQHGGRFGPATPMGFSGGRMFNTRMMNMHTMNMNSVRAFPSVNSSPFASRFGTFAPTNTVNTINNRFGQGFTPTDRFMIPFTPGVNSFNRGMFPAGGFVMPFTPTPGMSSMSNMRP